MGNSSIIVPTLFATNLEEFNLKISNLGYFKLLHIDIMDGSFVENSSLPISFFKGGLLREKVLHFHLMVSNPKYYLKFLMEEFNNVKLCFVHLEVLNNVEEFILLKKMVGSSFELGLAVNPNTEVEKVLPFLRDVSNLLLMSVYPGKEGQHFISLTYDRIKRIRQFLKIFGLFDIKVSLDGGINYEVCNSLKGYDLKFLYVGSYISNSENSVKRYRLLSSVLKNID